MESNLKGFVVKFGIVIGTLAILAGLGFGVKSYQEYAKEKAHLQSQDTIRSMVAFCDFSKLSDDERGSIEKCGDDVEAVRFRLSQIMDDRIVYWRTKMADVLDRMQKVENIKRESHYWDASNQRTYMEVMEKLANEGKVAYGQHEAWLKKKKDLKEWKPGPAVKTMEDPAPPKSQGIKA